MSIPGLEPAICQQCGYDLLGLPSEGLCPECGQAYDRASGRGIASRAAAELERGDRIALYAKVGILVMLGLVAVGLAVAGAWMTANWQRALMIGGTIAGALFAMAGMVWLADFLERRA